MSSLSVGGLGNTTEKGLGYMVYITFLIYPIQDLYGLKISQDILEGILKNKSLLLRDMRNIDRHGDGLIPKYDFINFKI